MVSIRTTVYLAIACVIPALFPSIVSGQDTTAASVSQLIRKFESAVALIDKEFEKEAENRVQLRPGISMLPFGPQMNQNQLMICW